MHDLIRLAESFYNTPWAMADRYLNLLEMQLLQALKQGSADYLSMFANPDQQKLTSPLTGATAVMDVQSRTAKTMAASGAIGVLPILGPIGHRANFMADYFGWPTTERLGQSFQQLVDDPNVGAIVFDINSPGGMASGNEELHQQIMKNRGKKPVVAVVNGMAASAAYYIASAADEIVVTPSSEVGSIGTVMMHGDMSKMYEDAGVKLTVIKAGKYKWEGNPYEPLTEEAQAEFQRGVDAHYQLFVNAVAKGRGVPVSTVKTDFGQGRMLMAKDAVAAGMADRIGTMTDVIARLGGKPGTVRTQAETQTPETENTESQNNKNQASELERLKLKNKLLEL